MPEIVGVYFTEKQEKSGLGGTSRDFVQKIHWFVISMDDGSLLVQPLGDNNLPTGITSTVDRDEFLRHYVPDPVFFKAHLLPVLHELRRLVGDSLQSFDPDALSQEQSMVLKALTLSRHLPKGESRKATLQLLRGDWDNYAAFENRAIKRINKEGIDLRKKKNYDMSARYYEQALALTPDDDHLLFNLARVYYEKGDMDKAREILGEVVALNPELSEAQRFLDFIKTK